MYYLIYQTQHKVSKMIYVGFHITEDPDDNYLGSGLYIKRAIKKDGRSMFEKTILHFCESYEAMVEKEKEIVTEEFIKREDTYNLRVGGEGGYIGEEYYASIRGKPMAREAVEKGAAKRRGQKRTQKSRQRMSDARKNNPVALETARQNLIKATATTKGHPQSEEHKQHRSEALKGHSVSETTRQKIREAHLKRNRLIT